MSVYLHQLISESHCEQYGVNLVTDAHTDGMIFAIELEYIALIGKISGQNSVSEGFHAVSQKFFAANAQTVRSFQTRPPPIIR